MKSLHMFSFLLLSTLSYSYKNKNRKAVNLEYGSCSSCIKNVETLLLEISSNDIKDQTISVTLYSNIAFIEELTFQCNLEFKGDYSQPNTINISYVFGNSDGMFKQRGLIIFENVNIIPVTSVDSTSIAISGNSIDINGNISVPESIKTLKGAFNSFKSRGKELLVFDEVTYSYLEYTFNEWPSKDIVLNQSADGITKLTFNNEIFEIVVGFDYFLFQRKDSPTIRINIKKSLFSLYSSGDQLILVINNCNVSMSQIVDETIVHLKLSSLNQANFIFAGEKNTFLDLQKDLSIRPYNSKIYISTDFPNSYYCPKSYIIITKSVIFRGIESSLEPNTGILYASNDEITVKVEYLIVFNRLTADKKIIIEADKVILYGNKYNAYIVDAHIVVKDMLELSVFYGGVNIRKLDLLENCIVISRGSGIITVNESSIQNNMKIFFYRARDDSSYFNIFPDEIYHTGLETFKSIICTNSVLSDPVQIFLDDNNSMVPSLFTKKNKILDIGLNETKMCAGVIFHKQINPMIIINVSGKTTAIGIGEYNVDSLCSADWNIQSNCPIERIDIYLYDELEGALDLDSLEIENCDLYVTGRGVSNRIKLSLSPSVLSKLKHIELSNIDIVSTTPLTFGFSNLILSSVILSEQAMGNIDFTKIEIVHVNEDKLKYYERILGKIMYLHVYVDECDTITFKESTIEFKYQNNPPREYLIESSTAILKVKSSVILKCTKESKLTNIHVSPENGNTITLEDDWKDLSPIYTQNSITINASKSQVISLLYDAYTGNFVDQKIISSEYEKLKFNIRSITEEPIDVRLVPDTGSSNINEFNFNDISNFRGDLFADWKDRQMLIKLSSIEVPGVTEGAIERELGYYDSDPEYKSYTMDQMRMILQDMEKTRINVDYASKMTLSSSVDIFSTYLEPRVNEIEIKVFNNLIPYVSYDSEYANETQFTFTYVDTALDFTDRFIGIEFLVANIRAKRCEDLKPFNVNNGAFMLSLRCFNEETGSRYHLQNAVIYAKIDNIIKSSNKDSLTASQIVGIVIGSIVVIVIITAIVSYTLMVTNQKRKNTGGNHNC